MATLTRNHVAGIAALISALEDTRTPDLCADGELELLDSGSLQPLGSLTNIDDTWLFTPAGAK